MGETLGELLLLLRASPVFVQDDDHFASIGIFGINGAFATHLDHFADLVLRLANESCQAIRLVLVTTLRDGVLGLKLEDCS
jgi:hypothetical protein